MSPLDPEHHRVALRDGVRIGWVRQHSAGPKEGLWVWGARWLGTDNRGLCTSQADALEAIRRAYQQLERTDPERLRNWPEPVKKINMVHRADV
ncbi:MAG: hypothetical protein AAGK03_03465 [Pseudomonadota bacterium]